MTHWFASDVGTEDQQDVWFAKSLADKVSELVKLIPLIPNDELGILIEALVLTAVHSAQPASNTPGCLANQAAIGEAQTIVGRHAFCRAQHLHDQLLLDVVVTHSPQGAEQRRRSLAESRCQHLQQERRPDLTRTALIAANHGAVDSVELHIVKGVSRQGSEAYPSAAGECPFAVDEIGRVLVGEPSGQLFEALANPGGKRGYGRFNC